MAGTLFLGLLVKAYLFTIGLRSYDLGQIRSLEVYTIKDVPCHTLLYSFSIFFFFGKVQITTLWFRPFSNRVLWFFLQQTTTQWNIPLAT